jgi:predicted RND superfamily exporter protein
MKKLVLIVLCLLLIIPVCAGAKNLSPEDKFKKSFPKNNPLKGYTKFTTAIRFTTLCRKQRLLFTAI